MLRKDDAQPVRSFRNSSGEAAQAFEAVIEAFVHALNVRENEPPGHAATLAEKAVQLAGLYGLTPAELPNIRLGALLHDIGKINIPESILLKPVPLTELEMAVIRKHPQVAYDLLWPIEYIRPALDIPYCHHELWDGSGYPRGLKEAQIPIAARIFAVVDVWDALCSNRPYRKAWPAEKALEYIQTLSGVYFDPHVVDLFLQMPFSR